MRKANKTQSHVRQTRLWPTKRMQGKLKQATSGKRVAGKGVQIRFMVAGGMPSERFLECIDVDSGGNAIYESEDKLRRLRRKKTVGRVPAAVLKEVFTDVRKCGQTQQKRPAQEILPDSLVGFLTVRSGDREETVYFPVELEGEGAHPGWTTVRLYSGRELNITRRLIPKRFIRAMESLSKVPEAMSRRPQRRKA